MRLLQVAAEVLEDQIEDIVLLYDLCQHNLHSDNSARRLELDLGVKWVGVNNLPQKDNRAVKGSALLKIINGKTSKCILVLFFIELLEDLNQ